MGEIASSFIKAFYEDGYKVVAITSNGDDSRLEQFRDLEIIILTGDATDRETIV